MIFSRTIHFSQMMLEMLVQICLFLIFQIKSKVEKEQIRYIELRFVYRVTQQLNITKNVLKNLMSRMKKLLNLTDIKFYVLKIVTRNTTNSYPMKIIAEFAQEYRGKMVRYQKNMRYTDLAQWSLKSVIMMRLLTCYKMCMT